MRRPFSGFLILGIPSIAWFSVIKVTSGNPPESHDAAPALSEVAIGTLQAPYAVLHAQPAVPVKSWHAWPSPTGSPRAKGSSDRRGSGDGCDLIYARGFDGNPFTGSYPFNPGIAAGRDHLVTVVNGSIRFFTKQGDETFGATLAAFFAELDAQTGANQLTYARSFYDHFVDRFFIALNARRSSDLHTWFYIAMSDDGDPNGDWSCWATDSTLNGNQPTTTRSDYLCVGFDGIALYLTSNHYSPTNFFVYAKLRIIPKAQLLAGAATISYSDFWSILAQGSTPAISIQPAIHLTPPSEALLATISYPSSLVLFKVNDPLGTPSLSRVIRSVPAFVVPPNIPQPQTTTRLLTMDNRLNNAVYHDGMLYAVQVDTTMAGNSVASCRWYEIGTAAWPTLTLTMGTLSAAGVHHCYPAIGVNDDDTVLMAFTRSGSAEYPSAYYAFRSSGDPPGTLQVPVAIKAGTRSYTGEGGNPVKWGEYAATALDPVDRKTFWVLNGYPSDASGAEWATWIAAVSGPVDLTVVSSPVTGVPVQVDPPDCAGAAGGPTPLNRRFAAGADVMLTAPAWHGTNGFAGWLLDGSPAPDAGPAIATQAGAVAVAEAVYVSAPFDADLDGDIDGLDFARFSACYSGPGIPSSDDCSMMDGDADEDVDLLDWTQFQNAFSL